LALIVAAVTWIWDAAVGDEFCEQDSKAPDIGFDGEPTRRRDSIKVYTTGKKFNKFSFYRGFVCIAF
jgi:hypothetical protein